MPRIRTVKPEFWTDSTLLSISRDARLFYIGTWNFAMCDAGHLEDDALRLKLQILPLDDVDVRSLIEELVNTGRVVRIQVDGKPYLHVKRLSDHQKVDGRWTPRCPVCTHLASPKLTQTPARLTEPHPNSPNLNPVKESKGKESKGSSTSTADAPDTFDTWWAEYPRKEAKGSAVKAYRSALKKTTPDVLLATVKARKPEWARGDKKFIPLPASWLNADRWEDEIVDLAHDGPPKLPSIAEVRRLEAERDARERGESA